MNQVKEGKRQEERAAAFLKEKGMRLLVQNFRCRQGEVDIVGLHDGCLVFVEVKYRRSRRQGLPEEAVGETKQMKICRTSDYFRICHPQYANLQLRYDVLAINGDEIRWHQNAFYYRENMQVMRW